MTDLAWLDAAALLDHLGVAEDSDNADSVERARKAAAAFIEKHRPDLVISDAFTVTADVLQGALLLAARLYARKGSPVGLASFNEFGAAQVVRFDSDIERLLGLGRYGRPVIG